MCVSRVEICTSCTHVKMEVMDTMLGKWKMDPSATENFDAYATAIGEY